MSSPMNLASNPSQDYYHHPEAYLNPLGFAQNEPDGFSDHLSMNIPSYSMQNPFAHEGLVTEHELPVYHQAPTVQHPQHLNNQGLGEPMVWPAALPHQIERQGVEEEDVLIVKIEHPLFGPGKPRLHWTNELHARFVRAVSELGGSFNATPKRILKKMKVKGLTREQIKSHLQKIRNGDKEKFMHQDLQNSVNSHSLQLSGQGSSTSMSTAGQGSSTSMSTASLNSKDLESFEADIEAYGKLLQSYETPMFYQNLVSAPMADYQDNTNGSISGL